MLEEVFQGVRGKITVVHEGVGEAFRPASEAARRSLRERQGLRHPFFLCVGSIDPRKNLGTVLKAWAAAAGGAGTGIA